MARATVRIRGLTLAGLEPSRGDTSDREGTGERLTVDDEELILPGSDIAPDRIVGPEEAGLGGGLDQAEEAILGITDEEIQDLIDNE